MGSLPTEVSRRIRAMSMWVVASLLLVILLVLTYAAAVGFPRVLPAPVEAVTVSAVDSHDLVVRYLGGVPGCGDPHHVEVEETDGAVTVRAFVVAPHGTRVNFGCPDVGVVMFQTVRLEDPLDGRPVTDGRDDGGDVPVVADLATLVGGG